MQQFLLEAPDFLPKITAVNAGLPDDVKGEFLLIVS